MNQTVNILRKDIGQLMGQISMPISALTLFTLFSFGEFLHGVHLLLPIPMVARGLSLLFCMSWVVVIISLVQTERLVGLNQFWTTRPYVWWKLLSAKFALILLFLYAPLILSQLVLLCPPRFPVLPTMTALLVNLLAFTALVVLPPVCAAALTRTPTQAVAVLLMFVSVGVFIASIGVGFGRFAPMWLLPSQVAISATMMIVTIVNQYRSRNTLRSVYLLSLTATLLLISEITVPGSSLVRLNYPSAPKNIPLMIRLDPNPLRTVAIKSQDIRGSEVMLHIPLLDSKVPPGTTFSVDGHRLTLSGPDGYVWRSPWLVVSGMITSDGSLREFTAESNFRVPAKIYDHLRNGSATVQIEFVLSEFEDQTPIASRLSTETSYVRGLGFCRSDQSYTTVSCDSAFQTPPRFSVQSIRNLGPCIAPESKTEPATGVIGELQQMSIMPHVTSIISSNVRFDIPTKPGFLCPGAPIGFLEKRFQQRNQIEMQPATVHLADYVTAIGDR